MKNYLFLLLVSIIVFSSCNEREKEKLNPIEKPDIDNPPTEPCENISWASLPMRTHGYTAEKFDTVIVKTYIKNSNFDSLVSTFEVLNDRESNDKIRQEKGFSLPKEITTDFDLLIVMGKRDNFKITEIQTDWVARYCQSFCGYECTITHYLLNGQGEGGNVVLKNHDFEYPWESIERKLRESSK